MANQIIKKNTLYNIAFINSKEYILLEGNKINQNINYLVYEIEDDKLTDKFVRIVLLDKNW